MSNANIGWLFYKKMFFNYPKNIKRTAKEVLEAQKTRYSFPQGTHSNIRLKTLYPGLVVGSGYPHSMKNQSDNFDFGFYFDYTTGMPVISGSTVKGMLRSYFGQNKNEKHKEQKECLITDFLEKIGANLEKFCETNIKKVTQLLKITETSEEICKNLNKDQQKKVWSFFIKCLVYEIFEGQSYNDKTGKYEPIPMHKRDIFYDAYVVKGYSKDTVSDLLFADDSITPHSKDGLREPTPNRMLKIAPDVVWQFSFDLKGGIITAEQKEELFLLILQWGGIGAKTNVGYGQFDIYDEEEEKKHQLEDKKKKDPFRKIKIVKKATKSK